MPGKTWLPSNGERGAMTTSTGPRLCEIEVWSSSIP